ncbi:Hypothetical predicted protein [Octopus vulgaris]|uniref:Transmembrane protein n=1 Tax=Octopus vulgaris TaxID=6645 RepID=A0AA36BAL8_OCTVU|nr:Hypothetical predicted protein [Octopus vulgaris]
MNDVIRSLSRRNRRSGLVRPENGSNVPRKMSRLVVVVVVVVIVVLVIVLGIVVVVGGGGDGGVGGGSSLFSLVFPPLENQTTEVQKNMFVGLAFEKILTLIIKTGLSHFDEK